MPGVFIAFEGGEGAGKSTQAGILHNTLQREGYCTTLLREPGSTNLGDYLREYLIGESPVSSLAELLLFEASRAQLMTERIEPLLNNGAVVIADRFSGSTIAYQGYGRGVDLKQIAWLNDLATGGLYPDLTILLDIDPPEGLKRANRRKQEPRQQLRLPLGEVITDRFEGEATSFHYRVSHGFLQQAAANPDAWRVIEGNHSIDDVAAAVRRAVCPLLSARAVAPGG